MADSLCGANKSQRVNGVNIAPQSKKAVDVKSTFSQRPLLAAKPKANWYFDFYDANKKF